MIDYDSTIKWILMLSNRRKQRNRCNRKRRVAAHLINDVDKIFVYPQFTNTVKTECNRSFNLINQIKMNNELINTLIPYVVIVLGLDLFCKKHF